jgi:hypothetical protein
MLHRMNDTRHCYHTDPGRRIEGISRQGRPANHKLRDDKGQCKMTDAASEKKLSQSAIEEVEATHRILTDWLRSRSDANPEDAKRYEALFADDFMIVGPDGRTADRAQFYSVYEAAKGTFADLVPPFEARVVNPQARSIGDDNCIVTYEIWRNISGKQDRRMMSVIMRRSPEVPGGFVWLHAHETWCTGHDGSLSFF